MSEVVEHRAGCPGDRVDDYESTTDSGAHARVRRCLDCEVETVEWLVRPELKMYDPWPDGHMHSVSETQLGHRHPLLGGAW